MVDSQLTHPEQNEFYLNSHIAIQVGENIGILNKKFIFKGTTRAPRYSVLLDDNKFSADVIEQLCYTLAYSHKVRKFFFKN